MRKKLTVVVTCTDRKSRKPTATLQARSLPEGNTSTRARLWAKRLSTASGTVPLGLLYQGEAWSQGRRLVDCAQDAGFDVRVLVASAGLGLQALGARFPAYAATFSPRHLDTVGPDAAERRLWWDEVNGHLGGRALGLIRGPALVVVSDAYSRALEENLEVLGNRNTDVTIFGAHRSFGSATVIRSDKSLRSALMGTVTSLNQRMAIQWLSLKPKRAQLGSDRHSRLWNEWVESEQRPEKFDRKRLDDYAVSEWIRRARRSTPDLSRTSALAQLRAEGFACEQKRFIALFDSVEMAA